MKYLDNIKGGLNNRLEQTDLNIGQKYTGKVRDKYILNDKIIMITTDRQSAFDRVLATIPFKGQVLNQTSLWWFNKTRHIVPNHIIDSPDPNTVVVKKCKVFPVEFVVRGYMTGSTKTSIWTNYQKGERMFCGNILPEGINKNEKLLVPLITPSTKSDTGDLNISAQEIVEKGLMSKEDWDYTSQKALELFRFGQATAKQNGLILVDTKYEFGKDQSGNILLIDEIHTPDSSRYWIASSYEERLGNGQEPENIDKEFLRLWFKDNCDPYKDEKLPDAPQELVMELSSRYIKLYEMITGKEFVFPSQSESLNDRIQKNLASFITNKVEIPVQVNDKKTEELIVNVITTNPQTKSDTRVVIIMGSAVDQPHVDKIITKLKEYCIPYTTHIASAHKQAPELLDITKNYKDKDIIYVTVAGRSNALSGFVAGNTDKVVIACPPFTDKVDMMVNINSTLQMPSNVPVLTVLDPANTALAIKRILKK